MKGFKRLAAAGYVTLVTMGGIGFVAAQQNEASHPAEDRVTVHIAPQPLRMALRVFADQTQLQVVYRSEQIDPTVLCAPVAGTYPAQEALARLLGASDLRAVRINARTLAIRVVAGRLDRKREVTRTAAPQG